jgi:hypothetical protein
MHGDADLLQDMCCALAAQTSWLHSFCQSNNLQQQCVLQIRTMRDIVKAEGYASLWHGVSARVLFHVPSSVVCWGVYETMKRLLTTP